MTKPGLEGHRATDPTDGCRGRVLIVTGMSGAGKSSVLKALEDQGFEAVDNLPLPLLEALVRPEAGFVRPVAIGVDIRTRDFGVARLGRELSRLRSHDELDVDLVFVDCDDDVLNRRFTETRRRHPLAVDRPLADGIRDERVVLESVREWADQIVDTTTFNLSDLKAELGARFALDRPPGLHIIVTSFSFARGLPRGADLVFDVRFLANPHYENALRPLTGRDAAVADFLSTADGFETFFDNLGALVLPLLPRYEREGKSYLTIAIGCTGGRHRSVYVAERLGETMRDKDWPVSIRHRDIDGR